MPHQPSVRDLAPLVRGLAYATVFVSLVLVFLPARLLEWSGVVFPEAPGALRLVGAAATLAGAALALWCVLAFAVVGRGTPAPFDPPRRLVTTGPYRSVRNPMYLGAGLALAGAATFYASAALFGFLVIFMAAAHAFIRLYEEPTLSRLFGAEYAAYCDRVDRWWPRPPGRTRNGGA